MANTLITPEIIAKRALTHLKNSCVMAKNVYRDYKKEWEGIKKGDVVNIRKPVQFTAEDGPTRVNQNVTEESTPLTINRHKHVSWEFGLKQLTLSVEDYDRRYIQPACIALVNAVDADLCDSYKDIANTVGTAGSPPDSFADLALAPRKLDDSGCPDDGKRVCVVNPEAKWLIAGALTGLYDGKAIDPALREGRLGRIGNMSIYSTQNIKTHTPGWAGTPLVNGASQTGSQLITDGITATSVILHGDRFTVGDDVFAVNPISRASTGVLRDFVVTADHTADGSDTLSIYPSIISEGAYQTVSAVPDDNDAINEEATAFEANLVFHPNAIALAMIPIELPQSCSFKARSSYDGFSVAVTKAYDIDGYKEVIRLDILYGTKVIYPEFACVLKG